ncbi:8138_t:CDS:2 [Ambispora gerdemannii]|uniref:8138_t:CDS:1 n=1 Tax=Ambispora gerdemannii TaxID=144530 RepID=A0A9N9GMB0_9GLOM|nr:8138_t:CDS:2 [Ambispora gerdemannii]
MAEEQRVNWLLISSNGELASDLDSNCNSKPSTMVRFELVVKQPSAGKSEALNLEKIKSRVNTDQDQCTFVFAYPSRNIVGSDGETVEVRIPTDYVTLTHVSTKPIWNLYNC